MADAAEPVQPDDPAKRVKLVRPTEKASVQAVKAGNKLLAWRMPGLPPGMGALEWLAAGSMRMPFATAAALLATWTGALFALWVGVYSSIGSVVLLLTGAATSGHVAGIFTFTNHSGTSLDFLAVLSALFVGFGVGFADSYTAGIVTGIPEVAAALLVGIVIGFIIALVAMKSEERILHWRGYRRPSKREWERTLEPALDAVKEAMHLSTLPLFMIADSPVPLAWTVSRHVVVSTGLMQSLDSVELQAVLAHELAHWRRGDAIALRMIWAFSWPVAAMYNAGMILSGATYGTPQTQSAAAAPQKAQKNVLSAIGWFFLWPTYILMRYVIGPATAHASRQMEYEADAAVVRAGLGAGLVRALERLEPFEPGRTAWEAVLSASHPPMQLRIEAAEEADPDEEDGGMSIEALTRKEATTLLSVCVILLVYALSPLAPTFHPHHHSWWNPW